MPPSLDPQAKADRAHEHIDTLARLIRDFANETYSVDMQPDVVGQDVSTAVIYAEASEPPPSRVWGPIIGDVVHGFRSALDQLIFALSEDYAGHAPYPTPSKNRWRDVAFPVVQSADDWKSAATQKLWAVDPALVALLKALQPFETGQHAPDREPLAVLQELWNIDKHRHLHLVNATVELHDVLFVESFPGLPEHQFEIVSKRAPGPLVGKAEIGRARPIGLISTMPHMHMQPYIAIDVAFDQGPPAHGGRVLETLCEIGKTVQATIVAF